jgi:DNA polymerase-3 subunit epsilon
VHVTAGRAAMTGDVRPIVAALSRRVSLLADAGAVRGAAVHRDRLAAFVPAAARLQRLVALTRAPCSPRAPTPDGGWEVVLTATAGWWQLPSHRAAPTRDPCCARRAEHPG